MANNRIAYGMLKSFGIDTTGLKPAEAWKKLNEHGIYYVTPRNKEIEVVDASKKITPAEKIASVKIKDRVDTENKELTDLLGVEFKGYKGQAAIDKLLKEKQGHVKGAFYREGLGDIDLLWGSDTVGLKHIIKRRMAENSNDKEQHVKRLLNQLGVAIQEGVFDKKNKRGNFEFKYNDIKVIIAPEYHNNKITYVLTAFENY